MTQFGRYTIMSLLAANAISPVHAGQLSSAMDGMFTATTSPQAFNTASMNGVAFGSASVRFPTQSFNIVAFDPPRINAGCSGIDAYMGSFSFINSEQMKAMVRSIAQGAVGYAFKAAIRSMCGQCSATLDWLEDKMQQLNAVGRNTCAIAKMVGEPIGLALAGKADEAEKMISVSKQRVTEWFEASEKNKTEGRTERANKYVGNIVWRALVNSGAGERFGAYGANAYWGMSGDANDLVMNLVGTYIVPTSDPSQKVCTPSDGAAVCDKDARTLQAKIGFDQILEGAATNGEVIKWYRCDNRDNEMGCQNPVEVDFTFEGTKKYVQRMLYGTGASVYTPTSDSIVGVIRRNGPAGLTVAQKNFLSGASSLPLLSIVRRTQRHPAVAEAILGQAGDKIAHEMAYRIVSEAINVAEDGFSRSGRDLPDPLREKIASLRAEVTTKGFKNPSTVMQDLANTEMLMHRMEQMFPRAYATAVKR